MEQQNNAAEQQMQETISRAEQFLVNNAKKLAVAIAAAILLAGAILAYKHLVQQPREEAAAAAMFYAQAALESQNPNFRLALEGDEQFTGFLEVADNYKSTAAGNLAQHYAGICYLNLGELENALAYLSKYKAQTGVAAGIINAQNLALQGDIKVEMNQYSAAVALFEAAANAATNVITTPLFLVKGGQAAQAAGDKEKAKELYLKAIRLYPTSMESRNAEKFIGTLEN